MCWDTRAKDSIIKSDQKDTEASIAGFWRSFILVHFSLGFFGMPTHKARLKLGRWIYTTNYQKPMVIDVWIHISTWGVVFFDPIINKDRFFVNDGAKKQDIREFMIEDFEDAATATARLHPEIKHPIYECLIRRGHQKYRNSGILTCPMMHVR